MPLTPADIHNVAFKKPPIGKRGYDEDEVDAFLDEVERELARLIEENNDLKSLTGTEAGAEPRSASSQEPAGKKQSAKEPAEKEPAGQAAAADRKPADGQSPDAQRLARENAELKTKLQELEQRLREAAEKGSTGPSDSEQALSVLITAQRTANEHVSGARREADKLLVDARANADELARSAKATSDALEKDARDKHQEAMGGLEVKRQGLQKHIEELKAFEREYRSRLKAYFESQLRDLEGKAAAADTIEPPPGAIASAASAPAGSGADGSAPAGSGADGSGATGSRR